MRHEKFGESIPYCEPSWYQGFATPYYKETHALYRNKVRAFVKKYIKRNVNKWIKAGSYPQILHEQAYAEGVSGIIYPKSLGGYAPPGAEKADYFHEQILWDELGLVDAGILSGALSINSMALPPLIMGGKKWVREEVIKPVIQGKVLASLMISEPNYGSDVAGIETKAVDMGDHWVVNGSKKWITGGLWSTWFTTAVRTGGPGFKGISLVLINKNMDGVKIRKMETQATNLHNTSFVTLKNVKVPKRNLIGKEGLGFMYIVVNFNHERWVISVQACRMSRVCYQDSIKYALSRRTFGKRLVDHQAIRMKLSEMVRHIEQLQDKIDFVTYQFNEKTDPRTMGGQCALLKVDASKCMELCAREASQIFGGSAIVREGKGARIERIYRGVRAIAIPGGSEEILLDFAIRQIIPPDPQKKKKKTNSKL